MWYLEWAVASIAIRVIDKFPFAGLCDWDLAWVVPC